MYLYLYYMIVYIINKCSYYIHKIDIIETIQME